MLLVQWLLLPLLDNRYVTEQLQHLSVRDLYVTESLMPHQSQSLYTCAFVVSSYMHRVKSHQGASSNDVTVHAEKELGVQGCYKLGHFAHVLSVKYLKQVSNSLFEQT